MMELDMFGQIVQDYEQLKTRAEQVFNIRRNYLPSCGDYIDNIDILSDEVVIESHSYSCGCCGPEHNTIYFPITYLLFNDDEIHETFKREAEINAEKERQWKIQREEEERQKVEEREWKTYLRLKEKYENVNKGETK